MQSRQENKISSATVRSLRSLREPFQTASDIAGATILLAAPVANILAKSVTMSTSKLGEHLVKLCLQIVNELSLG
jgi:hypothetical protein